MKKSNIIFLILFIFLIGAIFKNWLVSPYIIGGDWPFFYQEYISHFSFLPPIWNSALGNGFGGTSITYALDSYLYFTGWLFSVAFNIPWVIVYKIFWFGMFLIFSICSSVFLFRTLFPQSILWQRLLAAFIYTTNTYILLVVGGGQMGVALGYAIAPLAFTIFIKTVSSNLDSKDLKSQNANRKIISQNVKLSILSGFVFAVQVMFDFRMAYITMLAVILYFIISIRYEISKRNVLNVLSLLFYTFLIPLLITLLLHAFWILPLIFARSNPVASLGNAYTSLNSVIFFSFATFENALGLLHPYWPENIFGKVGFMKPEFLIIPILAYSSLLFLNSKIKNQKSKLQVKSQKFDKDKTIQQFNNITILYFALLGLIGIFLSKGANDPFGTLYLWMFGHIPGFVMFRDPTKWYMLIALSYSILIPFTVFSVYKSLNSKIKNQKLKLQFKIKKFIPILFVVFFVIFWLFTIRQAVFGQLGGTFAKAEVPSDYVALKNRLVSDNHFYRTLWVPKEERFAFSSDIHPAVEANALFSATDAATLQQKLSQKNTENYLADLGIKYIVVPDDVYGEIFLNNRNYSQKVRSSYVKMLDKITWLKKVQDGKLTIYQTKTHKDLFGLQSGSKKISYQELSPTTYTVTLKNVKKNDLLVFSENYSSYWQGNVTGGDKLVNRKFEKSLDSFVLLKDGSYNATIHFSEEKYYLIGGYLSLISLIILLGVYIVLSKKNRN